MKAKEKETGENGEHGSKGGLGRQGGQQNARKKGEDDEDERVQVAPNMGAGGSHPQAMAVPYQEEEGTEDEQQRR